MCLVTLLELPLERENRDFPVLEQLLHHHELLRHDPVLAEGLLQLLSRLLQLPLLLDHLVVQLVVAEGEALVLFQQLGSVLR